MLRWKFFVHIWVVKSRYVHNGATILKNRISYFIPYNLTWLFTVKMQVLTPLDYEHVIGFTDCLWMGYLMYIYCDLLKGKVEFLNK